MGKKRSRKPKTAESPSKVKKKLMKGKQKSSSINVGPESSSAGHAADASSSNPLAVGDISVSELPASQVQETNRYYGSLEGVQGFIFMCNAKTKFDCFRYRVFGLPRGQFEFVKKIGQGAMLFLFDTDLKLLYGIYEATSGGDLSLEPAAFDGRFPAQVKFHIFKDCLPLHERDFKNAIIENYNGSRFKQELSSIQVNNLISLFRPLPFGLPASAGVSLRDAAMPQFLQTRVVENSPALPTRHPHPRDSYGSLYPTALPRLDHQSVQLPPRSLHAPIQMETHGVYVHQSTGLRHVVQQPAPPHRTSSYYLADAHQPYLPDEPSLSSQHPYRRYGVTPQMIQKSRADRYQTGGPTSLLPREQEISVQSGYVADRSSQSLPPATHIPLQSNSMVQHQTALQTNSLVQHHTALPHARVQTELPTSYLAYYGLPPNEAASVAYADPTQRQRTSNYQLT